MTEKEYRALDRVSYSSLSKLASSPQAFKASAESQEEETSYMTLGTVVDILLTDKKRFDEEVYVMTADKPTAETMLTYCTRLAETGNTAIAYGASGYKISPDAVFKKFEKEGKAYYEALMAARGKLIIDADGMFTANQIVTQLTSNPFTKDYFTPSSENIEILFQFPIVWEVETESLIHKGERQFTKVKSLLDMVYIDHKLETITPVDLKTGGEGFMKSYWRWRRYLQASMYHDALVSVAWADARGENIKIDKYKVQPTVFVYADTNLQKPPMVYRSSPTDILIGREGLNYLVPVAGLAKSFKDDHLHQIDTIGFGPGDIQKIKGYQQLIQELDWHIKMDQWDYTHEDFYNSGEREINAFSIKL